MVSVMPLPSFPLKCSTRAQAQCFLPGLTFFGSAGRDELVLLRDRVDGLRVSCSESGDLGLEVGERLEAAVDGGEAEVRHLVELPERLEDRQADLVARDLGLVADALLDRLGEQRQLVLVDGAALAGLAYAADDLGAAVVVRRRALAVGRGPADELVPYARIY